MANEILPNGIPASISESQFRVYTYKLLPKNTFAPVFDAPQYDSPDSVKEHKNEILWDILNRDTFQFSREGAEYLLENSNHKTMSLFFE